MYESLAEAPMRSNPCDHGGLVVAHLPHTGTAVKEASLFTVQLLYKANLIKKSRKHLQKQFWMHGGFTSF